MTKQISQYDYDRDFYSWAFHNAQLVRQGKFQRLDIRHVAEEIEKLGRNDMRRSIKNLVILLAYLLKWQFQPEKRSKRLNLSILNQRIKVVLVLDDSPSLNKKIKESLEDIYQKAVFEAVLETALPEQCFPKRCPYSWQQCLDYVFLPN